MDYESKIPAKVKIYSSDNPPERLSTNMAGKEIMTGKTKQNLIYNTLTGKYESKFKVSVNEATSDRENGWVFLVVSTDYDYVAPYIVDHLTVVSKKKKKTVVMTTMGTRTQESLD